MARKFHKHEEIIKRYKWNIENSSISEKDKKVFWDFERNLVLKGLSAARISKYYEILWTFYRKMNKNFHNITKEDLQIFLSEIQQKDYSEWTKQAYRVIIKKFFWWLNGDGERAPEIVGWIKINFSKSRIKLPNEGDLLIEEDIKKLLNAAEHIRDKAFISTLWESGCRIGELATLKIKDVVFDKYGCFMSVFGKTGARKIRLISSTPYLANYLQSHSCRECRDEFLWVNIGNINKGESMTYGLIRKTLCNLFAKAGIKKRFNPHSFRHARATYLANHLTEFQMNQYFGWIQGSRMSSTYVHLSGKNTEEALLKLHGIENKEDHKESLLKPKKCPRCSNINSSESSFCSTCGGSLDLRAITELDEKHKQVEIEAQQSEKIIKLLLQDNNLRNKILEKLTELKIQSL